MTAAAWLQAAQDNARQHGHDDVLPVLEVLAGAIRRLRDAAWNRAIDDEAGDAPEP